MLNGRASGWISKGGRKAHNMHIQYVPEGLCAKNLNSQIQGVIGTHGCHEAYPVPNC